MKKTVSWISLGAILIIAAIVIYYAFNKPRNSVSDLPVYFTVTAGEFVQEFISDDEKANNKYLKKVIEVTGIIAEINMSDKGTGSNCILRRNTDITGVICEFEPGLDIELKNYQIGDNITIKGKYSGFLMDVVLNTCEIIK